MARYWGIRMCAAIRRLRTRPARLRQDENGRLREALLPFRDGAEGSRMEREEVRLLVAKLLAAVDGATASVNRWSFVMLSPDQNDLVVNHLAAHSARPFLAMRLWSLCFRYLRMDTGEIVLSREEIAEKLGASPEHVSRVVGELVEFGALSRRRESVAGLRGRGVVRYFMNPNVGTHLSGKARDEAQAAAPKVVPMLGGVERSVSRPAIEVDRDRSRRRWQGPLADLL